MKELKNMIATLTQAAKENPKEFWGGLIAMATVFIGLWAGLWLIAICEGRV